MSVALLPLKSLIGDLKLISFSSRPTSFQTLKNSIIRDGLLNPLIVIKFKNKYKVIDGKKRLSVLRRLSKCRSFTRSLHKVPCIIETAVSKARFERPRPLLMSEPELAHAISQSLAQGLSHAHISQRFDCDSNTVEDVETLKSLSPKLLKCFNDQTLSLSQAVAFATIPNERAQWDLLLQLGPFLSNKDIIKAIKRGDTVLELPDDNVLIIPSRKPSHQIKNSVQYMNSQKTAEAYTHRLAA